MYIGKEGIEKLYLGAFIFHSLENKKVRFNDLNKGICVPCRRIFSFLGRFAKKRSDSRALCGAGCRVVKFGGSVSSGYRSGGSLAAEAVVGCVFTAAAAAAEEQVKQDDRFDIASAGATLAASAAAEEQK